MPIASAQTVTYIHTDAVGSVVAESDANGNVTKRYDYEPYGAVVGGQVTDGPGYTGHVSDAATGLSYMQQRYMDPQLGAFLSVDPVTAYDQPVGQFNRYRYANGNPYRFIDPDGRQALGAPRDFYHPVTAEQAQQILPVVADFTPVLGDVKGIVEAVHAPTPANIAGAAMGLIPFAGDAGKAVLKHGDEAAQLGRKVASEQKVSGTIYVDSKGNAIPTPPGGRIEGSPDGRFVQAKGPDGQPTGVRIDGGHKPSTHPDPRAQQPHGHVPGVTNADGTPWLPVKQ
jgi:RHS repeat-associated protein